MVFTRGHALIIGIGSYAYSPHHSISITAADAQAVAIVAQNKQFCGYPAAQVSLLHESRTTRASILAALDRLTQTSQDATVLLFYSGRGDYDTNGIYTLTTHDTRWQDGRVVPGTAISQTDLLNTLCTIPAKQVLLLFNVCHARELLPTLGDEAPLIDSTLPQHLVNALLSTGSGRMVITSCCEHQGAFIGSGTGTLFTQMLVEGLRGGGEVYNRNGYISVFDLYTQLYSALHAAVQCAVPQHSRDHDRSTQNPELSMLTGAGPFAVALYRGASTPGDFPTDHTPAEGTAVRMVPKSHSQRALHNISNSAPNQGAQGTFYGPVTFNQQQQIVQGDHIQAGGDVTHIGGDYVARDKISGTIDASNIAGVGIAIGHGASVRICGDIHYYPITLRAPRREVFDPLIEDRMRLFGGRGADFSHIAEALQQSTGSVLLITAPAGFGKTALLAALVNAQPDAFAYHFFTPLYKNKDLPQWDSLSEYSFLQNVVEQMAQWHGHTEQLPTDLNELRALYHQFFDKPLEHTRVLVLDGLDEVTTWSLAPYLNRRLPDGLHLILSVRDVGQDWQHDYQLPADQVAHLPLNGLQRDEVAEVLRATGNNGAVLADEPALLEQVMQAAAYEDDPTLGADPFYVRLLAEDAAQGQITPANVAQQPRGLDAYLDRWWQEIRLHGDQPTRDLFGTLTAALGPLARTDLEAVNPSLVDDWEADYLSTVLSQVRRFVLGDAERGYALAHPRLRDYLRNKIRIEQYRVKLLAYCDRWQEHHSRYALVYYVRHLHAAGEWETMRRVLTEIVPGGEREHSRQPWAAARYHAEGSYVGYLADLDMLWTYAQEHQHFLDALRCALIHASLSPNLSPELTLAMVIAGTPDGAWSVSLALTHLTRMRHQDEYSETVERLWQCGASFTLSDWHQVIAHINTFSSEKLRADALRWLIPSVPAEVLPSLRHSVQHLQDTRFFAGLAGLLEQQHDNPSPSERTEATIDRKRKCLLQYFAGHPSGDVRQGIAAALSDAQKIDDAAIRQPIIATLTALDTQPDHTTDQASVMLPAEAAPTQPLPPTALHDLKNLSNEWERAEQIVALLPGSTASLAEADARSVLMLILDLRDDITRAWALQHLIPVLPFALLPDAFQAVCALWRPSQRDTLLAILTPRLVAWSTSVPHATHQAAWMTGSRLLARYGRPAFLDALRLLLPWLKTITSSDERAAIIAILDDVGTCWP